MNTGRNMKLLFFQWHSFMNKGIERGLKELEIPYDTFFYQFNDWEKDDAFLEQFRAYLKAGSLYGRAVGQFFAIDFDAV